MSNELLELDTAGLKKRALDVKMKIVQAKFDKATGKLMDTANPRKLRRDLARVLTRMTEIKTV